jgi:hypothetical protein
MPGFRRQTQAPEVGFEFNLGSGQPSACRDHEQTYLVENEQLYISVWVGFIIVDVGQSHYRRPVSLETK